MTEGNKIIIIIIIITDREIDHRRPDITDHVKNNNKDLIIDIAVPSDSSVEGKEREGECLHLEGEDKFNTNSNPKQLYNSFDASSILCYPCKVYHSGTSRDKHEKKHLQRLTHSHPYPLQQKDAPLE